MTSQRTRRTPRLAAATGAVLFVTVAPATSYSPPVCADQSPMNTRCEIWAQFLQSGGTTGGAVREDPAGVVATADGKRLYVATTNTVGGSYALVAVDTAWGAPLWVGRPAPGSGSSRATHLALAPDESRVLVAGTETSRAFVVAYAPDGRVLWRVSSGDPRSVREVNGLAVAPRGGARGFLLTTAFKDASRTVVAGAEVVALDLRNGRALWRRMLTATGAGLAVSPAGDRVYVAATSARSGGVHAVAAFGLDARSGAVRWSRGAMHSRSVSPVSVAVTGRGDQVVLLSSARFTPDSAPPRYEWFTVSFGTADGRERWRAVEAGDPGISAVPYGLVTSGDRVYATGSTGRWGHISEDLQSVQLMTTVAYDARLGRKAWRVTYEPPGGYGSIGTAIAATGSHVYVAGVLAPGLGVMAPVGWLAVVAYRTDGTEAWVSRRDAYWATDVAAHLAAGVVVPPLGGRLFVVTRYQPASPSVPVPLPDTVRPPDVPDVSECAAGTAFCIGRGSSSMVTAYAA